MTLNVSAHIPATAPRLPGAHKAPGEMLSRPPCPLAATCPPGFAETLTGRGNPNLGAGLAFTPQNRIAPRVEKITAPRRACPLRLNQPMDRALFQSTFYAWDFAPCLAGVAGRWGRRQPAGRAFPTARHCIRTVLPCSGVCPYVLGGIWRRLADQATRCTPITRLAVQKAALHSRAASPAQELWVCTHRGTWEGSCAAAEHRGKQPARQKCPGKENIPWHQETGSVRRALISC